MCTDMERGCLDANSIGKAEKVMSLKAIELVRLLTIFICLPCFFLFILLVPFWSSQFGCCWSFALLLETNVIGGVSGEIESLVEHVVIPPPFFTKC